MGPDESRMLAALKAHSRELIDPKVAEGRGPAPIPRSLQVPPTQIVKLSLRQPVPQQSNKET